MTKQMTVLIKWVSRNEKSFTMLVWTLSWRVSRAFPPRFGNWSSNTTASSLSLRLTQRQAVPAADLGPFVYQRFATEVSWKQQVRLANCKDGPKTVVR